MDGGLIRENLLLNHANGLATDKTNFLKLVKSIHVPTVNDNLDSRSFSCPHIHSTAVCIRGLSSRFSGCK